MYILSSYQEKNYKANQKLKTQFEETHEATEPDMAGVGITRQRIPATAINGIRALLDGSRQHARKHDQCKQRDRNPEKRIKMKF